jgi:hypothetical protein
VRVAAYAFGDGQPRRDVCLSPDHGVSIDGVLIPVRYLINGATIVQEAAHKVAYWHVELDRHEVLLAEGLGCESYLDTGNRDVFANGGGAVTLHPDFALDLWKRRGCLPLVLDGAELEAARSYLAVRADMLGFRTTEEPDLRLLAGGREIAATRHGAVFSFDLPAGSAVTRLLSRSAVPAEVHDRHPDHRRLGVAVAGVLVDGVRLALDDRRMGAGWHPVEHGAGGTWRWTDGNAALAIGGAAKLVVEVAMTARYWQAPAGTRRRAA